jgi:hypothetical protein
MESNPDEFRGEYGRWADIRNSVFAYKEQGGVRSPWIRGLTNAEIDAMYEKLSAIHRVVLDEYVMKNVLDEPNENETLPYQMAQGKRVQGFGWNDPSLLARNTMAKNAIQPGTMISVTAGGSGGSGGVLMQNNTQVKPESVMSKLKRELGL